MTPKIESEIKPHIERLRQLISVCASLGSRYPPPYKGTDIPALEKKVGKLDETLTGLLSCYPAYLEAESYRYDRLIDTVYLAMHVKNAITRSFVPHTLIVQVGRVEAEIRQQRIYKKRPPIVPLKDDPHRHVAADQATFDEQIERFERLISLVASHAGYVPRNPEIEIAALESHLTCLHEANDTVYRAIAPLVAARQIIDEILYAPKTGLLDVARDIKEHLKIVFGEQSAEYLRVNEISFENE